MSRQIELHFPDGGLQRRWTAEHPRVGETVRILGHTWIVGGLRGDSYTLTKPRRVAEAAARHRLPGHSRLRFGSPATSPSSVRTP